MMVPVSVAMSTTCSTPCSAIQARAIVQRLLPIEPEVPVRSFGRQLEIESLPNLTEIQTVAYEEFLAGRNYQFEANEKTFGFEW